MARKCPEMIANGLTTIRKTRKLSGNTGKYWVMLGNSKEMLENIHEMLEMIAKWSPND